MTDTVRPLPRNFASIQAARAVAAVLVVLYHSNGSIFALPKYWNSKPFGDVLTLGEAGVFFFFVLSGFIILHVHYKDLGRPEQMIGYFWKRLRRIYPIYWVVLLLVLPIYFKVGSFGKGYETQPYVVLSSFLLVHIKTLNVVSVVSWTLFHEILFYALFALAIWRARLGFTIIALWLALSFVGMATGRGSMLTEFWFSYLHLLFGFGMAAACWMRRRALPRPATMALLGLAVFLVAGMDDAYWQTMQVGWRTLLFGLGATLVLAGLVELERQSRLRVPAWLRLLGDASYSIYLVHFFALSLLAKLAWSSGAARLVPASVAFLLLCALAIGAGTLCHLVVERPLLAVLSRRTVASRRQSVV